MQYTNCDFTPVYTKVEYAKERTSELLNKVYGGNAKELVSAMLNNNFLSEKDIDDLKGYWSERRKEK